MLKRCQKNKPPPKYATKCIVENFHKEVKHEYSCPNSRPNMSEQHFDILKIMGYKINETHVSIPAQTGIGSLKKQR